jgi:hypothetical protein
MISGCIHHCGHVQIPADYVKVSRKSVPAKALDSILDQLSLHFEPAQVSSEAMINNFSSDPNVGINRMIHSTRCFLHARTPHCLYTENIIRFENLCRLSLESTCGRNR